jgi:enamine deaminase RidA (YjgF/YER057c/UK114 family)
MGVDHLACTPGDSNPPTSVAAGSLKLEPVNVERRLEELGLVLPAPAALPAGVEIPFAWVRVHGDRAFISGHGALDASGTPAGPFGKVPSEISLNDAQRSARLATLTVLSSLKTALGDLDRIGAWLMINGYVNADPGYRETTAVMNPCSELIVDLYGADAGTHARTAIGVATVPLNLPVVISAEVAIEAQ